MDVIHPRCCGLDVHQKTVAACVLVCQEEGKKSKEVRTFGTWTQDLQRLADWLGERGVTHVAMEATGIYWKPVWAVLAGQFQLLLVNAQHIKAVPGRKTDVKDSEWIADLLQHGLLRGSFVPPQGVQDLRDLTRYRARLTQERSAVANRIQKLLEEANIKLSSVASDVMGASGQQMLRAIIAGESDPERLAKMARKRMRTKIPELRLALEGKVREHHRDMLRRLMKHWSFLGDEIASRDDEIKSRMGPFERAVALWQTIPGINEITAWNLVAEVGVNMDQFPSPQHLASWAGLCPGNNESAGKRKSGRTRYGAPWLKRALCLAAWAASHTRNTYFSAQYRRLAARRGKKRAIIAVAHSLLIVIYCMLKQDRTYEELGGDHFDRLHAQRHKRYLVKRLEALGFQVNLAPAERAA
jgi:transposase